jgi:Ca-activated chloride channel homolog
MKLGSTTIKSAALLFSLALCAVVSDGRQDGIATSPAARRGTLPVHVTVNDVRGRPVDGLELSAFSVTGGGEPLEAISLSRDAPVSLGILLDLSGRLSGLYQQPEKGGRSPLEHLLTRFARDGNPENEYSIIAFNKETRALAGGIGGEALSGALGGLGSLNLDGPTALYDACAAGVEALGRAKHRRRVLLLVTDGEDGGSRLPRKQLLRLLREGDVTLQVLTVQPGLRLDYDALLLPGPPQGTRRAMAIPSPETARVFANVEALTELASVTGGWAYFPQSAAELADTFGRVATELRHQYLLGVAAPAASGQGEWVKLKIKVKAPKGLPSPATVRSRESLFR